MNVQIIEEKKIYGLVTRTKNADEMNENTGKIGLLWKKFDEKVDVNYKEGERVYGIYSNYESDANGEFDVFAGYDSFNKDLELRSIEKGRYLVFTKSFTQTDDHTRVQAIIATWGKVWEYFSNEKSEYKRAYKTDFEWYKGLNEIEICISIK